MIKTQQDPKSEELSTKFYLAKYTAVCLENLAKKLKTFHV